MRILMFGWEFPPNITGGLGTACYGLSEALTQKGHRITFVMPRVDQDNSNINTDEYIKLIDASTVDVSHCKKIEDELFQKIDFITINSNIVPYTSPEEFSALGEEISKCNHRQSDLWRGRYSFKGGYGRDLMQEVTKYAVVATEVTDSLNGQFDVIHAHDWLTYPAGIEAKKISGKPLIVHVHATQFDRASNGADSAVFRIEREGMMAADRVVTVSELTKNIVIKKYGISPDKIDVVHNGVTCEWADMAKEKQIENQKIVTFLGRVTYQKGPEYFIEMARRLLLKMNNVKFIIAGSGDMLPTIMARVEQLGLSDKFIFTGFLDKQAVQDVFLISDVYVMPSVSEPFGISPLEAMLSNVPTIISKQSGVSEVVHNAIKIDYWDIDAMADAVYGVLSYPYLYHYMVREGREEALSIKWSNAALRMVNVYKKAINQ